jgi:hypothetical protein
MAGVVDDFYVRPELRGEGLGSAALAAARRACEDLGLRALRVEVDVDDLVAQAVYRSAGFDALRGHGLMAVSLAPPAHDRQGVAGAAVWSPRPRRQLEQGGWTRDRESRPGVA